MASSSTIKSGDVTAGKLSCPWVMPEADLMTDRITNPVLERLANENTFE